MWLCAIGEPTRLAIIRALAADGSRAMDIAKACGIEMVAASHHLVVLKRAGLVTSQRDGRNQVYVLVGAEVTADRLELTHPSGITVTIPLG